MLFISHDHNSRSRLAVMENGMGFCSRTSSPEGIEEANPYIERGGDSLMSVNGRQEESIYNAELLKAKSVKESACIE